MEVQLKKLVSSHLKIYIVKDNITKQITLFQKSEIGKAASDTLKKNSKDKYTVNNTENQKQIVKFLNYNI